MLGQHAPGVVDTGLGRYRHGLVAHHVGHGLQGLAWLAGAFFRGKVGIDRSAQPRSGLRRGGRLAREVGQDGGERGGGVARHHIGRACAQGLRALYAAHGRHLAQPLGGTAKHLSVGTEDKKHGSSRVRKPLWAAYRKYRRWRGISVAARPPTPRRSEEHTSELQSQSNLVCRLLLEKKKKKSRQNPTIRVASDAA